MKNTTKKTQFDLMLDRVKEVFGEDASIYSTNYYNPGRRYQLVIVNKENGGHTSYGANLQKQSFIDAIDYIDTISNGKNITINERLYMFKHLTNLKTFK